MKSKNLLLILFSMLSLTIMGWFYLSRPPVDILNRIDFGCRIFGGSAIQKDICYKNALWLYMTDSAFKDVALVSLQDLCDNGQSKACFAFDRLKEDSYANYSPVLENVRNGNLDALRCIDTRPGDDSNVKSYFCEKSLAYGKLLRDGFLVSEIIQNYMPFTDPISLSNVEMNITFGDKYINELKSKNCMKPRTQDELKYCSKFERINNLRREILKTINKIPVNLERTSSLIHTTCKEFQISCMTLFNDFFFFLDLYNQYPSSHKQSFLESYSKYLSFQQRILFWALLADNKLVTLVKPLNLQDAILQARLSGTVQNLRGECNSVKATNKEGCFLTLDNLTIAIKELDVLEMFCRNQDSFSCKLIDLIRRQRILNIPEKSSLYSIFNNYEEYILNSYLEDPARRMMNFVNRNRAPILFIVLLLILFFQILLFRLFIKSRLVFEYIREETKNKIKIKLNKTGADLPR